MAMSVYSQVHFRFVYSSLFLPSFFSVLGSSLEVYHSQGSDIRFLFSGRSYAPLGIITNPTKEMPAT